MRENRADFVFVACLVLACAIACAAVIVGASAGFGNPFGIVAFGVLLAAFVALAGLAAKIAQSQKRRLP
jgi:hypothetical protein